MIELTYLFFTSIPVITWLLFNNKRKGEFAIFIYCIAILIIEALFTFFEKQVSFIELIFSCVEVSLASLVLLNFLKNRRFKILCATFICISLLTVIFETVFLTNKILYYTVILNCILITILSSRVLFNQLDSENLFKSRAFIFSLGLFLPYTFSILLYSFYPLFEDNRNSLILSVFIWTNYILSTISHLLFTYAILCPYKKKILN